MKHKLVGLLWTCAAVCTAQTANTVSVRQYPGETVGQKVAAAQAACNANPSVPCVLVIDPALTQVPAGDLPTPCAQCSVVDLRNGARTILPGVVADRAGGLTMSGTLAAKTLSATNLPITVTAPPYNAVADCATDNTAAFQAAINAAAVTGQDVYVPQSPLKSCYKFTSLYFYYDANLNPGYPVNGGGHSFKFYGSGRAAGLRAGTYQRTVLISTATNRPALNLGDGKSFFYSYNNISDMTINATSSSWIIFGDLIPNYSAFRNLTLDQFGSGGGIFLHNVWSNTLLEDLNVIQAGTTIAAGSAGVKVCNDIDAGLVTLNRVSANGTTSGGGWDHGFELGSVGGVDDCGKRIEPITLLNVDAERNNTGIYIGHGPMGSIRDFYTEVSRVQGIYLGNNNQWPWTISAGYMFEPQASAAGIFIDGPNAGSSYQMGHVSISGTYINHAARYAIYINDSKQLTSGMINGNFLSANGPTAVAVGSPSAQQNWIVENNQMTGFATPIPNLGYLAEYRSNGAVFLSRPLTTSGLYLDAGTSFYTAILPPANPQGNSKVTLPAGSGTVGVIETSQSGKALCETSAHKLGHCVSPIGISGACDCR